MTEITYKELSSHLEKLRETPAAKRPQAYLFYGEELLYKKAFDALVETLLPAADRSMNCEPVDGAPENIRDAVYRVNTYSLMGAPKVVAVQESRIFYGNQEKSKLLEKAKESYQKDDIKKAAKYVLSLLGQQELALEDMGEETLERFAAEEGGSQEIKWLRAVIDYCREQKLKVPSGDRPDQALEAALEKGFPSGNYLVLTTDLADKRRTLFKCFKEKGLVVDCSVPKGDRKADRAMQEDVLKDRMKAVLDPNQKKMDPRAFAALYEMTGFDLRTFENNLEKLVLYAGGRATITADDVAAVLSRSRQDPIYELTGALSDRNLVQSLRLLESVLQSGLHPLQVFTAVVNQFRKLLVARSFLQSSHGRVWKAGTPYGAFVDRILPAMEAFDRESADMFLEWDSFLKGESPDEPAEGPSPKKKKKQKKNKLPEDLLVAANPKNPYPLYLLLNKADHFRMDELAGFYIQLGETDITLKRSGRNPKLILEEMMLRICRKG